MKKFIWISLMALVFIATASLDANAQHRKKKKKKKKKPQSEYFESKGITDKLWYGAGGALSGYTQAINLGTKKVWQVGLSPFVGYKILPWLSAGPRIEYLHQQEVYNTSYALEKINSNIFAGGVFLRAKPFPMIFAHAEYTKGATRVTYYKDGEKLPLPSNIEKEKFSKPLLGLGYSSGGDISYEILALYDFSVDDSSAQIPIVIRAGLTYKF